MYHEITVRCLAQWSRSRNYHHSRILLLPPRNTPFILSSLPGQPADPSLGLRWKWEVAGLWGSTTFLVAWALQLLAAPPQLPPLSHAGGSGLHSFLPVDHQRGWVTGKHVSIQQRTLLCPNRTFVILAPFQPQCQGNRWSPATVIPSRWI